MRKIFKLCGKEYNDCKRVGINEFLGLYDKNIAELSEDAYEKENALYFLRNPRGKVFIYQQKITGSSDKEKIESIRKARQSMFDICIQNRNASGNEHFGVLEILPKNESMNFLLNKKENVKELRKLEETTERVEGSEKDCDIKIVFTPDKDVATGMAVFESKLKVLTYDDNKIKERILFCNAAKSYRSCLPSSYKCRKDPNLNKDNEEEAMTKGSILKESFEEESNLKAREEGSILKESLKAGGIATGIELVISVIVGGSTLGIGELVKPGFAMNAFGVLGNFLGKGVKVLGGVGFGSAVAGVFLVAPGMVSGIRALVSCLNSDNRDNGEQTSSRSSSRSNSISERNDD